MKPHEIELEGLQSWFEESKFLFARSTKEQKTLYCTLNGTFILEHRGKEV